MLQLEAQHCLQAAPGCCRSAMEMDEAARLEEELANIKKERDDLETKRASCTRRPATSKPGAGR